MSNTRNNIRSLCINIFISLGIGGCIFFIGTIISFNIFLLLPGDPVYALLESRGIIDPPTEVLMAMRHQLGFDLPIFSRYFRYLSDLLTGNWGHSISIASQTATWELIKLRLPRTIDLMLFPMIIASGFGIIVGRYIAKNRGIWYDKLIQLVCVIGLSLPIFFLGILLQYTLAYLYPMFPVTNYRSFEYEDPPFVTGFYIIDSILSGQFYKISDYLYHLVLPISCLIIISFSLITIKTRSYMLNQSRDKSVVSNTVITGFIFGFIFMFTLLVEITFGLNGFGSLLEEAIDLIDYWVISATLNVILIMFVILTLISNLVFILYRFLKKKKLGNKIELNLKGDI